MRTDIFVAAEMYTNQLIDGYKEQRKYVQLDVRKGRTCLKENQILMLVETIGEEKERALIGLAMDKAKTHEANGLHWISRSANKPTRITIPVRIMYIMLN
ncbi:DUF3693 domain-containing protein [Vibrio rotiferianus]|uniref:DUF3693 domain-containing protein n=1 Tax=Vibrio rotiferianus TaxID=190895 RepID=UPI003F50E1F3